MAKKTTASASPAAAMAIAEAPADTKRARPAGGRSTRPRSPRVRRRAPSRADARALTGPISPAPARRARLDRRGKNDASILRAAGFACPKASTRRSRARDAVTRSTRSTAGTPASSASTPRVSDSAASPPRYTTSCPASPQLASSRAAFFAPSSAPPASASAHAASSTSAACDAASRQNPSNAADHANPTSRGALLLHRPAALGRTSLVAAARRTTIGSCVARKHGRAARGLRAEQIEHDARLRRVEVASRLVGENHVRLADDGASERDALLLAAGEQLDPRRRLFRQSDRRERLRGPPPRFAAPTSHPSASVTLASAVRPSSSLKSWKTKPRFRRRYGSDARPAAARACPRPRPRRGPAARHRGAGAGAWSCRRRCAR